jgi:hypothetical protein
MKFHSHWEPTPVAMPTSLMRAGNISLTIGQGSGPHELGKMIRHAWKKDGTGAYKLYAMMFM